MEFTGGYTSKEAYRVFKDITTKTSISQSNKKITEAFLYKDSGYYSKYSYYLFFNYQLKLQKILFQILNYLNTTYVRK